LRCASLTPEGAAGAAAVSGAVAAVSGAVGAAVSGAAGASVSAASETVNHTAEVTISMHTSCVFVVGIARSRWDRGHHRQTPNCNQTIEVTLESRHNERGQGDRM
jgi:hypothetical protein